VFKSDCGTESNTEKEKGESSDSFKRACVNWGIGRELYTDSLKNIMVKCELVETKKDVWKVKNGIDWYVKEIEYADNEVSKLVIVQTTYGKDETVVYSFGTKGKKVEKVTVEEENKPPLEVSKKSLTLEQAQALAIVGKDGKIHRVKDMSEDELDYFTTYQKRPDLMEACKLELEERQKVANGEG
jgi:hypothetical protein